MATNATGPAVGATLSFTTAAAALPTPPEPLQTTATVGDQQISMTTPATAMCTTKTAKLSVPLTSKHKAGSHATKLTFTSATLTVDKGIKHTKTKTKHLAHGKTKKVKVVTYTPNATVTHMPATPRLSLKGLKARLHALTGKFSYRHTVTTKGHKRTVHTTKTLKAKFAVC